MISIITAIYNQLAMNRIFYDSIVETTDSEFELIIIDNMTFHRRHAACAETDDCI